MVSFKKWHFRLAQLEDAFQIREVFLESVTHISANFYNKEEIIYWNSNKTVEKIEAWIGNPNFYFLVAEEGETIHGLGFIDCKTGELYACYLRPTVVGNGLGKVLMDMMLNKAMECRLSKVFLRASLNAKNFYKRYGFQIIGDRLDLKPPDGIPHYRMELLL